MQSNRNDCESPAAPRLPAARRTTPPGPPAISKCPNSGRRSSPCCSRPSPSKIRACREENGSAASSQSDPPASPPDARTPNCKVFRPRSRVCSRTPPALRRYGNAADTNSNAPCRRVPPPTSALRAIPPILAIFSGPAWHPLCKLDYTPEPLRKVLPRYGRVNHRAAILICSVGALLVNSAAAQFILRSCSAGSKGCAPACPGVHLTSEPQGRVLDPPLQSVAFAQI